jgi:hypothetical protein
MMRLDAATIFTLVFGGGITIFYALYSIGVWLIERDLERFRASLPSRFPRVR